MQQASHTFLLIPAIAAIYLGSIYFACLFLARRIAE